jgi:imidazolonepropionase
MEKRAFTTVICMKEEMKIIGPFKQIITLRGLALKGAIEDSALEIVANGAVLIDNEKIVAVGDFEQITQKFFHVAIEEIEPNLVLLPGFIDCHTHTCFGGSRANDFALRIAGKSYLEIAQSGGGIWNSVLKTRELSDNQLFELTKQRVNQFLKEGITTLEIKSGYGLSVEQELKLLRVINQISQKCATTIVPTCLAAHLKPKDFEGNNEAYLEYLIQNLFPILKSENLCNRIDIFIEKSAFGMDESRRYLASAKAQGFDVCVHADQFTAGSSDLAVAMEAVSADHLEASQDQQIAKLANSNTVAVVLPGASLGLGEPFAPARKLLNGGACVAIASDYNPGSAPMGDLLMQASVLACFQKLNTAEILAGLTFRAAAALRLPNYGKIEANYHTDMQAYLCNDYREILYNQGKLKPNKVWKHGELVK